MSDEASPGGPLRGPGPDEAPTVSNQIEDRQAPPQDASGQGPASRRRRLTRRVAAIALLVVAAVFLGLAIGHYVWPSHPSTTARVQPSGGSGSAGSGALPFGDSDGPQSGGSSSGSGSAGSPPSAAVTAIAAKVDPALVNINVKVGYRSGQGAATGIVLTPSGLVLTNNHVIDGATAISATDVGNGKTYSATVVGYDRSHDMAVIQLKGASGLTTAQLGDSSRLTVGQKVVAVGNAGGTGGTPSAAGGSIVALDRRIIAGGPGSAERLSGLIETDAAVQPGDSGGPLVNTAGQVIGIDAAASGGYSFRSPGGQGFAVPVNTAMTIANQIENQQASATVHIGATGFLGVELVPSGEQGGFGGQSGSSSSGATVAGVLSGSPAAHAGLVAGDAIVSVDGQTVASPTTLRNLLSSHHPGDRVLIGWKDHSGGKHTAAVQLASGPAA